MDYNEQYWLLQDCVEEAGINVVSCGNCGDIFLHRIENEEILKCPHCDMESDPCDFPDLFTYNQKRNEISE